MPIRSWEMTETTAEADMPIHTVVQDVLQLFNQINQ